MSVLDKYGFGDYKNITDKRVVLLQSGGLDSCVLSAIFSKLGFDIHHLFIDYGFNTVERDLDCAKKIVDKYGGELHISKIEMPWLKDSTKLVGSDTISDGNYFRKALGNCLGGSYVPMRNTILLSIAASLCESLDFRYIATAINGNEDTISHLPTSGCPDAHYTYVRKLEYAINEGSKIYQSDGDYITILAPFLNRPKFELIDLGDVLEVDFAVTRSCYVNTPTPCGRCIACLTRKENFEFAGLEDPIFSNNDSKKN